jgi:hypothetical protein
MQRLLQLSQIPVLLVALSLAVLAVKQHAEIDDLKAKSASNDSKAAAAVEKLERDLFAQRAADQNALNAAVARTKAEWAREVSGNLKELPSEGFHKTVNW